MERSEPFFRDSKIFCKTDQLISVNYLDSKSIFNMLIFKGIPFFHFRFYQLFGQAQMPGMDVCVFMDGSIERLTDLLPLCIL